jgi:N-acylneuraminate cytidylyltransferase
MSWLALIPARAGSKRIPGKNVRPLGGHPLLAYTIAAARDSAAFARIIVSTESEEVAAIARAYGAETPFSRPPEFAGDLSPDIEWVGHALAQLPGFAAFALLRPTSPFRTAATIRRAASEFNAQPGIDSLRAVERCRQHPGKMWVVEAGGARMRPLLSGGPRTPPWHSTPYQALPRVHVQNASLEIAWTRVVRELGTISGEIIAPFSTTGYEGFDLNSPEDWIVAEHLVAAGKAELPPAHLSIASPAR